MSLFKDTMKNPTDEKKAQIILKNQVKRLDFLANEWFDLPKEERSEIIQSVIIELAKTDILQSKE